MLKTDAKIIPVFYDVRPSDLRYSMKGVYADAFVGYEQKGRCLDQLEKWKEALHRVSFINGYEFSKNNLGLNDMCEKILSAILKELSLTVSKHSVGLEKGKAKINKLFYVAEHPVGIDKHSEYFERVCLKSRKDENIAGIFGMGGSGKTTLAKELYNRKRSNFDGSCFLYEVRQASSASKLTSLQTRLLNELFHQNHPKFQSIDKGNVYLRRYMKRGISLRFLIVIDDVNDVDELDALLDRDAISCASLVIITTRNESVLKRAGINVRSKIQEMDEESSKYLFCWHTFSQPCPAHGYKDLVDSFVKLCRGSTLSLKLLGRQLSGHSNRSFWQLLLGKLGRVESGDIKGILEICIDSLDSEQRQIFMDMGCFFIGKPKEMAIRI